MNPSYPQSVLDGFNELRKSNILTDITLVAGSKRSPAHRLFLMAVSEYFARVLQSVFREARESQFVLNETPEMLGLILDAMYGQWKPSGDFRIDFPVAGKLLYYQVRGFDPDYLVLNTNVSTAEIPEYLKSLSTLYGGDLSEELVDHVASFISPETDLSEFSDETITALLTSSKYNPKTVMEIYNLISSLIAKGHSMELAALINYDLFPDVLRNSFPQEFLRRYSRKGPLPRLGTISTEMHRSPEPGSRSEVKVVINTSPTPGKDGYTMINIIDATSERKDVLWPYIFSLSVSIGDIVTLQVWFDRFGLSAAPLGQTIRPGYISTESFKFPVL